MRRRFVPLVTLLVSLGVLASAAPVASASSAIASYGYNCSNGKQVKLVVSGLATIPATTPLRIHLTQVKFTFQNNFGAAINVTAATFTVPDPNNVSAPYVVGALTGPTPAGWTGSHVGTAIQASYSGAIALAPNASFTSAPLRAKYKDNGPSGTIIDYRPGSFSVTIAAGVVNCTLVPGATTPFVSITE